MRAAIGIGLELPPLHAAPVADSPGGLTISAVARAVERAGLGALWLPGARIGGLDAGPLAGAAAVVTEAVAIGLVDRPSRGRHPSMLAREVVTIDRVSDGRAAVAVVEEAGVGPVPLVEATELVHRLLSERDVTFAGRTFEVGELTLRPRPVAPGGPPVLAGVVGTDALQRGLVEALVSAGADAVVTGAGPNGVARLRAWLDATTAGVGLLWRGTVPAAPPAGGGSLGAVLDEGADGLVVVLPDGAAVGGRIDPAALDRALRAVTPFVGG